MENLILSVPTITPARPSLAPGIIKTIIQKQGYTARVVDINIHFWNDYRDRYGNDSFFELDNYFGVADRVALSQEVSEHYEEWSNEWVERICEMKPKHIFVSVFTWNAQRFTFDFLQKLKPATDAKIIIGGQGIGEIREQTSFIGPPYYAIFMKEKGLIDHWIKGEAEKTIPLIVDGIYQGPGIDSNDYAPLANMREEILPDFTDVDIKSYHSGDPNGVLPIEISRGCVRKCNFCDWPNAAGGFRVKTGSQLFEEVKHQHEAHGIRNFYFVDALMNGSVKEFNKFNELLLEYYKEKGHADRFIQYSGHFIIRENSREWGVKDIELMGRAGASIMVVGIESGSDSVRKAMNKGFTTADIDFHMKEFVKYGVSLYMLMMAGYPTETDDDHQQTLDLIRRYQQYVANGTVAGINFGQTFVIEEGAPIYAHPEQLDLKGINGKKPQNMFWHNPHNPTLTYKKRIQRRIEAQELAAELGYPIWRGDFQLTHLMNTYTTIQQNNYNEHKIAI